MRLYDLIDADELREMLDHGFVRATLHPSEPLTILNYTQRAQFDRVWNHTTRTCRGLIFHSETRQVIARPWPKFHNYGEHMTEEETIQILTDELNAATDREEGYRRAKFILDPLDLDAPVLVTDKLDGSLGIAYPFDLSSMPWGVATRGSFTSDQALVATGLMAAHRFEPEEGVTYLFEIIYPGNRIVVDYQGQTKLVLLGGVTVEDGVALPAMSLPGWDGERVNAFPLPTLRDALALEPRANAEGLVVQFVDEPCFLVKIKQDDYVRLHRIVTGMNERTVWELLREGQTPDDIMAPLPEEFWPWVNETCERFINTHAFVLHSAKLLHTHLLEVLPETFERKEYALLLISETETTPTLRSYCFTLLDDKDPSDAIWRSLRPSEPRALVTTSEDVA